MRQSAILLHRRQMRILLIKNGSASEKKVVAINTTAIIIPLSSRNSHLPEIVRISETGQTILREVVRVVEIVRISETGLRMVPMVMELLKKNLQKKRSRIKLKQHWPALAEPVSL